MKQLLTVLILSLALTGATGGCNNRHTSGEREQICGGYTRQREISGEEMEMFRHLTDGADIVLTPLSVSTQVVAGTNYRFWCRYQDKSGSGHCWVVVFKPLPGRGEPTVTSIDKER